MINFFKKKKKEKVELTEQYIAELKVANDAWGNIYITQGTSEVSISYLQLDDLIEHLLFIYESNYTSKNKDTQ